MTTTLLANTRFLSLPSDHLGKDWMERSGLIDSYLEQLGMELSEETVFMIFDRAPGAIIAGEGHCLVARSVIGPKSHVERPLQMTDWIQGPIHLKSLVSLDWDLALKACYQEWENLQRSAVKIASPFMILVNRRLAPELIVSLEVLFHE